MATSEYRDETPTYVYRCDTCNGVTGACVADLNDALVMRSALRFKRDAEKRGKSVEVMAVSDVRAADWCGHGGHHGAKGLPL